MERSLAFHVMNALLIREGYCLCASRSPAQCTEFEGFEVDVANEKVNLDFRMLQPILDHLISSRDLLMPL